MNASVPMAGSAKRLRMDRSRHASTVHGERPPGDPHAGVHFYQDGLPFDAQGFFVDGMLDDASDRDGKLRELVERRLRKLEGAQTPADAEAELLELKRASGKSSAAGEAEDVNVEAWARGEATYLFGEIRDALRNRFSQVVKDQRGALDLLLDEKVVTEAQLAPVFKQLLGVDA